MDICDRIIELRIALMNFCEGFSQKTASKELFFSNKTKVLFLLEKKDCTPSELIGALGMAKSNLANLLKGMCAEGLIITYKNADNTKNVFYTISDMGKNQLQNYKCSLKSEFFKNCSCDEQELNDAIDKLLKLVKGEQNEII
ncbi:MAG: winged helix-turn-helix transcriptional regulator [Clostridia bacterium]|nr:winged helix-turn-helix transcriptional regulator [Clostridia bacterium]